MKERSAHIFIGALACVVLIFSGIPTGAEEGQSETIITLEQTSIPAADPLDIARRVRGVEVVSAPAMVSAPRQVGERQIFWASGLSSDQMFQVEAELRAVGQHIYLWAETGTPIDNWQFQALAEVFDTRIYGPVRDLWGSEVTPGIDGDPRLYGLFARGLGQGTVAYYSRRHSYPAEAVPSSNEHEMFFFNLDTIGAQITSRDIEATLAHEFQHMIRANIDGNQDGWLDEGFSTFTELYLGYSGALWTANNFLGVPDTQLNTWAIPGASSGPHYGASVLFVTYFYERYGLDALQSVSSNRQNGLRAFNEALANLGEPDVNSFFADWVLANALQDRRIENGRYAYTLFQLNTLPAQRGFAAAYPYSYSGQVNQYASDYFTLGQLAGNETLDISISTPQTANLIPAAAASGDWFWYSNRGDASDLTLTRAFDLTTVEQATLTYNAWYQIEEGWDYAYVMVSADGGASWEILPAPRTTTYNPHGNAYGPGYTGDSGGWFAAEIALDAYAGHEVLVRFEVITDDAVNMPGLAIDDVTIPEIGYFDDFENGGGGWQAGGWVYVDNNLPQYAWVQAVQRAGNQVEITRWLLSADDTQWSLPLMDGADSVLLAISPIAPVTTVPMSYTLTVTAR